MLMELAIDKTLFNLGGNWGESRDGRLLMRAEVVRIAVAATASRRRRIIVNECRRRNRVCLSIL